jgi:hypothetical protein
MLREGRYWAAAVTASMVYSSMATSPLALVRWYTATCFRELGVEGCPCYTTYS